MLLDQLSLMTIRNKNDKIDFMTEDEQWDKEVHKQIIEKQNIVE